MLRAETGHRCAELPTCMLNMIMTEQLDLRQRFLSCINFWMFSPDGVDQIQAEF